MRVELSPTWEIPAHPLLFPTERGPGREREHPEQQLWDLREPRAPGAALLGRWEALSQKLLQVLLFKVGAQVCELRRGSLVPLGLEGEWC